MWGRDDQSELSSSCIYSVVFRLWLLFTTLSGLRLQEKLTSTSKVERATGRVITLDINIFNQQYQVHSLHWLGP